MSLSLLTRTASGLRILHAHGALCALLVVGAVLLFTNLGRDYLWEDEGDTAVLAATVLKSGVPRAWDGVTFTESDHGARLNRNLVMVSHPWMQYYVVAASFAVFGQNSLAARLPFALAGLGTVLLVYLLVLQAGGNRRAAIASSVLLLTSVQFLLFARQSRNYSLHAFLTCLLVWQFFRLRSWRSMLAFALTAGLLFHTHPVGLAAVAALALATLAFRPFAPQRPWCLHALPLVAALTLPWLAYAWRGYGENTLVLQTAGQLGPRLLQFIVECASVTPLFGVATLLAIAVIRQRRARSRMREIGKPAAWRIVVFPRGERRLVLAVSSVLLLEAVTIATTQSRDTLWAIGVRYTPAVLPFVMLLAGVLIEKATLSRRAWLATLLVFGFTTTGRITPWMFSAPPTPFRNASQIATVHQPSEYIARVFRTSQLGYLASLFDANPGTIAQVSDFINANAQPHDLLVTNYEWDPLYFHTQLPQAMKVAASDASYESARALGLPEYVFAAGKVRWIVWRRAWGSEWGQDCAALLRSLAEAGVPVQLVTTVPETLWENRENVHFRRYPGNRYVYPFYPQLPDTLIYRVDWPGS